MDGLEVMPVRALVAQGTGDPVAIYERLALDDIRVAARVLEPTYRRSLQALTDVGILLEEATAFLVRQCVEKFERSFDDLAAAIERKREARSGAGWRPAGGARRGEGAVRLAMDEWRDEGEARRLWEGDAALWTGRDEDRWLGWLHVVDDEASHLEPFERAAAEAREAGFRQILLLGMGGSSLFPWMLARTFGSRTATEPPGPRHADRLPGWVHCQ